MTQVVSSAPVARRVVLVGALATSLTACGGLDERSVQDNLQEAVEGVPQYADGQVQFVDNFTQGTVVSGILRISGDDRAAVTAGLEAILEAVAQTYPTGLGADAADVKLTGYPVGEDTEFAVSAAQVLDVPGSTRVTTDHLREHFGL